MFLKLAISILICFIPLIAGFLIFFLKAKIKLLHLLIAIVLGLVAIFPSSIIQFFIPSDAFTTTSGNLVFFSLLKSLLMYGFLEEIFKAAFILPLVPVTKRDFSLLNFLCLSLLFGLSFGCFESVIYFLDNLQKSVNRDGTFLYSLILSRLLTSDILHTACSGLCGLFVYSCFHQKFKVWYFLEAVILHGLYDFFIGFRSGIRWFFVVVLLLAVLECRLKYVAMRNDEEGNGSAGLGRRVSAL